VPRPRIAMRKIRDVLRLSFGECLSRRQISASLGIPLSTLADCIGRARLAGLSWPLPDEMDDAALERALFPPTAPSSVSRPMPDWNYIHIELRKKAVTLQLLWIEYREQFPEGLGYSQFCNLYSAWRKKVDVVMRQHHRAGEKMFVDFPGMTIPIYDRTSQCGGPTHSISCNCGDPSQQVWWFEWLPWALTHGHNPMLTNAIWARLGGVNALSRSATALIGDCHARPFSEVQVVATGTTGVGCRSHS
jgi:hypothetical protein